MIAMANSASAAVISYVGVQFDVEDATNTPTAGWRNTTTAKPLDVDGDNVLGSDGYFIYHNRQSVPSYATTIFNPDSNVNRTSRSALWDDPSDPTGADIAGSGQYYDVSIPLGSPSEPLLQVQITDALPVGETLRLGVLFDINSSGTATYTLEQIVGGSQSVTTPSFAFDSASLDVAFFDISGVSVGDTFNIRATNLAGSSTSLQQVVGITYDTGVVPEPSVALLGGLGTLLLLLRRRR